MDAMDLTAHWVGITAIVVFVVSYSSVIAEEFTHLRKSVPVILGAGIIWALIAYQYLQAGGLDHEAEQAVRHFLIEFGELFLFLLCAMTYVNAMGERRAFDALRSWLVHHGFTYRQLFWITGVISFFLSPIIDNLTTALVMGAVVMAVGQNNPRFVGLHQHRGGGKRRRCVQPVRRHHHADGVATGHPRFLDIFCAHHSIRRELPYPRGRHVFRGRVGEAAGRR
jgi:hypothetical protein